MPGSNLAQSEKDFVSSRAESIDCCLLTQLEHTLHMLLRMGRQVVRSRLAVILDIKELATPVSTGCSVSGTQTACLQVRVCVGAARNHWTRWFQRRELSKQQLARDPRS